MKRIFLGLILLLSSQGVYASGSDIQKVESKNFNLEKADALNARSRHSDKILPPVGVTLSSSFSAAIFTDGTISNASATLTVLNKSQGLARISIGSIYGPHEFLIGLVGDEYFGTSVDREGSIFLERVSNKYLEVTFTRIVDATGLPIQVRAKFRF